MRANEREHELEHEHKHSLIGLREVCFERKIALGRFCIEKFCIGRFLHWEVCLH